MSLKDHRCLGRMSLLHLSNMIHLYLLFCGAISLQANSPATSLAIFPISIHAGSLFGPYIPCRWTTNQVCWGVRLNLKPSSSTYPDLLKNTQSRLKNDKPNSLLYLWTPLVNRFLNFHLSLNTWSTRCGTSQFWSLYHLVYLCYRRAHILGNFTIPSYIKPIE